MCIEMADHPSRLGLACSNIFDAIVKEIYPVCTESKFELLIAEIQITEIY